MIGNCKFERQEDNLWRCAQCGYVYKIHVDRPPIRVCREAPDLTPIAQRLADETGDPTIIDKIGHYGMALARYAASGFKTRSKEEIQQIYAEHCLLCEDRDPVADACKLCGCNVRTEGMALLNMLAMRSEKCKKGKW